MQVVFLEWCCAYSRFTNNKKITVGFIDDLTKQVNQLSGSAGTSLISSYPPVGFKFGKPIKTQGKPGDLITAKERTPEQITEAPKSKGVKDSIH